MEKSNLKSYFFVGEEAVVDAFVEELSARCLFETNKTMTYPDGHVGRLIKYQKAGKPAVYIGTYMDKYQECPKCGKLVSVDDLMEVQINHDQRRRDAGQRYFRNTETMCRECVESHQYIVPEYGTDKYLYVDDRRTRKLRLSLDEVVYFHCIGTDYRYHRALRVDENGQFVSTDEYYRDADVKYVWKDGRQHGVFLGDINAHPENWLICSSCQRIFWHEEIQDGKCETCRCPNVIIHGYHGYCGTLNFLKLDEEIDQKRFFGTEVETQAPTEDMNNRNKNLIAPYQDVWHLERDGSLPSDRSFEMISQPMTLAWAKAHYDDFATMFKSLIDGGQESHEARDCGFHVHVSRAAFNDDIAIKRAIAIVHGLAEEMGKFGRRTNGQYFRFDANFRHLTCFSENDIDQIPHEDHYCAVNVHYDGDRTKTVEFRFPKGTLNVTTYMATLEFINNIVTAANSDKDVVKFGDLLDGDYIPAYIAARNGYGVQFNTEAKVVFKYMNTERAVKAFCTNPTEQTTAALCAQLSALSGSQVVFCTVPDDSSETVSSEATLEGEAVTEGGAA